MDTGSLHEGPVVPLGWPQGEALGRHFARLLYQNETSVLAKVVTVAGVKRLVLGCSGKVWSSFPSSIALFHNHLLPSELHLPLLHLFVQEEKRFPFCC
jgi:hypothetical protein